MMQRLLALPLLVLLLGMAGLAMFLPAGHAFTIPENLFRKITDEERADWQQKFSGIRT